MVNQSIPRRSANERHVPTGGMSRRRFLQAAAASAVLAAGSVAGLRVAARPDAETRQWRVSGDSDKALAGYDQTMQKFMQDRNIPGSALAVTRYGHLMLARGYTWSADPNELIEPTALFRIASVTKPITSAAIMRLVQEQKFNLTDKMVDILNLKAGPKTDPRLKDITVLNLLQHQGGWDRDTAKYDPMFLDYAIAHTLSVKLPISAHNIVTYMNDHPLQHDPGTTYSYSNYGYCLLGRIIEQVTHQTYERYVQKNILNPLNLHRMIQGHSLIEQREMGEVSYYTSDPKLYPGVMDNAHTKVQTCYGTFNLENMDSHGRWTSSVVDMVRFASSFDQPTRNPVLAEDSIQTLFAPPDNYTKGTYYACGWSIVPVQGGKMNTWHDGSLPGTTTLMVRRFDGLNWAVFFNQSDDPSKLSYGDIDGALHIAADAVTTWPDQDLFEKYAN